MRRLSEQYMHVLQEGFLSRLLKRVIADNDLDLQIRNDYLNIYYKGNALLKLTRSRNLFQVTIDPKFRTDLNVPPALNEDTLSDFLSLIPSLKVNIERFGNSSLEIEYEQLIIRANNQEPRTNSEYYILDRQYSLNRYRFDLIGFFWQRVGRRRDQEVPLCLMEVKFALNSDIQQIHGQLGSYYNLIKERGPELAEEYQTILRQKLELGLFRLPPERIEAMKTLRISPHIDRFRFVIILVDYNPYSKHLNLEQLKNLPFANQIWLYHMGFAMWSTNASLVISPADLSSTSPVEDL